MATRVGTLLDRYVIDAKLGQGAMGVVYLARDPKLQRTVAIKTISVTAFDPAAEQEFRKRFVIEAQAAGRLSHPGIVTIFDVREEPEPFLVMEYVEGQSLQQLINRGSRTLPLSTTLRVVQEVAQALHYAHSQGVVHRDIKPSNILVTPDGHPKIADFGVAKSNQTDLTLPGQVLGSPAFMAPEQLTEEGSDARSDLFSLGVILYYMLTGHRPFQGNSTTTVCFKLVNQEPVPVSAFEPKLSPDIDAIVSRAMAKDPTQRYQSGMMMAADIQSLRERSGFIAGSVARDDSSRSTDSMQQVDGEKAEHWQTRSLPKTFLVPGLLAVMLMGAALWSTNASRPKKKDSLKAGAVAVQSQDVNTKNTDQGNIATKKEANTASPVKQVTSKTPVRLTQHPADAMLQIEVEHHFTDASTSVWLDSRLIYTKSLRGTKQRRALLFRQVSGQQFDVINVPSGIHQVRVRVHSDANSYDQSKMIVDASIQGASLLRITCGLKGSGLQLTLQKAVNQ